MFDIREYYDHNSASNKESIKDIESDISYDIDNLLKNRFDKLYLRDRYKNNNNNIDIIYPKLNYPGNPSLICNPDKIRNLLSFYPEKSDLNNIEKIVLRPRYIEIGNIELISLYLRKKKIIVLYLYHPHYYQVNNTKFQNYSDHVAKDLGKIIDKKTSKESDLNNENSDFHIHPLWYITSLIESKKDDIIDKFFIKKEIKNQKVYEIINDISFYYSRHGY